MIFEFHILFLIERGGGKGPMKPSNRFAREMMRRIERHRHG